MRDTPKLILMVLLAFVTLALILFSKVASGQEKPSCSILEKIDEDDSGLAKIFLKIGKKRYSYKESRITRNSDGSILSVKKIKITDNEKELALLLLNIETCQTEILKAIKKDGQLVVPVGYDIRPVKRASGLTWNAFNTQFEVLIPLSTVVLKNAWPKEETRNVVTEKRDKNGKIVKKYQNQKYVKNTVYTLYSADNPNTVDSVEPGIHSKEVVSEGSNGVKNIINEARNILRSRRVFSKTFPDQIVSDLLFLPSEVYERLILAEQSDYNEFLFDRQKTMERILITLRGNKERAFASCNSRKPSRACGILQFTDRWRTIRVRDRSIRAPGTYSTIVRGYPDAGLIKTFPAGAFDHVNIAMAAILLHDHNANLLFTIFGEKIIEDPVLLGEALAGCYNGSYRWTIMALEEYFDGKIDDWIKSRHLKKETREYIIKYRYVAENNLP